MEGGWPVSISGNLRSATRVPHGLRGPDGHGFAVEVDGVRDQARVDLQDEGRILADLATGQLAELHRGPQHVQQRLPDPGPQPGAAPELYVGVDRESDLTQGPESVRTTRHERH